MKLRDEVIIEKITQAIKILDEIDEMIDTQPKTLQQIDYELSDYYHLIENENLKNYNINKIVERIKELRKIRRSLNNENAIEDTFRNHKQKLIGNDTRQFLLTEINKKKKDLSSQYKNRILTEKMSKELLDEPKVKRGRPRKEKQNDRNIH